MPKKVPSVQIREKGKGFEARPMIDGTQVSIYRKTFKEVQDELAKLHLSVQRSTSSVTLGQFLTTWLNREKDRVATGRRSYATYASRKANLEKYVIPGLGHVLLRSLDRAMIKAYFERLEREAATKGLSSRSGQKGTRALQLAFETARTALNEAQVDDKLLVQNPFAAPPGTRRSIKPHHEEAARNFLTLEQWESALAEAVSSDYPDYLYPLLLTALTTGMRQGELFGLMKTRVDLSHRIIHVVSQASESFNGLALKRPKMATGSRTKERHITIPEQTATVLAGYMTRTADSDLVFPNSEGHLLGRGNFMERRFRPLLRELELPSVDFHSIRHTHASTLISAGVNIKTVSKRLGHENIKITLDVYGHLLPDDDAKAAEVFDGKLSNRRRLRAITSVG